MDRSEHEAGRSADRRITWRETRARLERDRARLDEVVGGGERAPRYPSFTCVRLHRLAHYFHARGWRWSSRVCWQLCIWATGADIHPASDLGAGLVIVHPAAISISGRAGENLTVHALAGVGGMLSRSRDVGAGPGLPVLGDDVTLGPHAGIMGPVRIGDRATLLGCMVKRDVPSDAVVEPEDPRLLTRPSARGEPAA